MKKKSKTIERANATIKVLIITLRQHKPISSRNDKNPYQIKVIATLKIIRSKRVDEVFLQAID